VSKKKKKPTISQNKFYAVIIIGFVITGLAFYGIILAIDSTAQLIESREERILYHLNTTDTDGTEVISTKIYLPEPGRFEYNIFVEDSADCTSTLNFDIEIDIMINDYIVHSWSVYQRDTGKCGSDSSDAYLWVDEFWESTYLDSGWTKFNVSINSNVQRYHVYIRYMNETIRDQEITLYFMIGFHFFWTITAFIVGPAVSINMYSKNRKKLKKAKLRERKKAEKLKAKADKIKKAEAIQSTKQVKYCPLCGASVSEKTDFCSDCGNEI